MCTWLSYTRMEPILLGNSLSFGFEVIVSCVLLYGEGHTQEVRVSTGHQAAWNQDPESSSLLGVWVCAQSLQSCPTFCDPMDCSHQAPLSVGFTRQEYCGLPFPPPGDLPVPGIKPVSPPFPACRQILYHWATEEAPSLLVTYWILSRITWVWARINLQLSLSWDHSPGWHPYWIFEQTWSTQLN